MARMTPLKKLVVETGITQREIADLLGIHETSFSSIVNGRLIPSEDRKREIADALCRELDRNVDVDDLWPPAPEALAA